MRFLQKEIENISEKNKKISKNNHFKEALQQINIQEAQNCTIEGIESYDHLQAELGELKATLTGSQRLITKLDKLGDHCPTCEQDVDPEFISSLKDLETRKLVEAEDKSGEIEREIQQIKKDKEVTEKKITETEKKLKEIKNKKPVVKKKTGSQAVSSLKNRLKK